MPNLTGRNSRAIDFSNGPARHDQTRGVLGMLKTLTEIDPSSTGVRSPARLFGSPQTVIGLRLVCLQARLNRNRTGISVCLFG